MDTLKISLKLTKASKTSLERVGGHLTVSEIARKCQKPAERRKSHLNVSEDT